MAGYWANRVCKDKGISVRCAGVRHLVLFDERVERRQRLGGFGFAEIDAQVHAGLGHHEPVHQFRQLARQMALQLVTPIGQSLARALPSTKKNRVHSMSSGGTRKI
jgi:hypothetical protein